MGGGRTVSVPSDLSGLAVFVLGVLPGLVFQGVRTAIAGERLGAGQIALRTVEALVVGVVLWLCWLFTKQGVVGVGASLPG